MALGLKYCKTKIETSIKNLIDLSSINSSHHYTKSQTSIILKPVRVDNQLTVRLF